MSSQPLSLNAWHLSGRPDGVGPAGGTAIAGRISGGEARLETPASESLEARFDRAAPGLYRFVAVRVGRDKHLADDLMQQLWLAAHRNGAKIAVGEFEAWLRGAARNLIATHWRRVGARPDGVLRADPAAAARLADMLATPSAPVNLLTSAEATSQLMLALTALDAEDQELLSEHYVRGQGHAAIAARLGIGVRAVEGRLYRARQALRQRLVQTDDANEDE